MQFLSDKDRHFVLACYTVFLLEGNSILGTSLKVPTVKGYLQAADSLFDSVNLRKPYMQPPKLDLISPLLDVQARWELQPNRCEPISDEMFTRIQLVGNQAKKDSVDAAISDWVLLGRFTGHRKSEWSQDSQSTFAPITDHLDNPAHTFRQSDFVFRTKQKRIIPHNALNKSEAEAVEITWHFQKKKNRTMEK
jgi:hypothetical protein